MGLFKKARIPIVENAFASEEPAQHYDEHAGRFMLPVYRSIAEQVTKTKITGNRVLDIGTGSSRLAITLANLPNRDFRITGIDISEDMLEIARRNMVQSGLVDRIKIQQASAAALPFGDGYFDLVVSNASLHHWANPVGVFNEIVRVTSPGGYCLLMDNLRLPPVLNPLTDLIGRLIGMNKNQRQMWQRAIRAGYTPGEVRLMLNQSRLKDARIRINPGLGELSIEWREKHFN
jgi:ubiquinone/menaquinone biosynthesis C-methylase UbiE